MFGNQQLLELGTRGSNMGRIGSNLWEPAAPRTGNPWFQDWEALVVPRLGSIGSNFLELLVPRTGNPRFQDWEASVPTFGNQQFLELATRGSKIGKHCFQCLGIASS